LYLPWTSPLLQIRFELFSDGLAVFYPDGEPFAEPEAILLERDAVRLAQQQAQTERDQALLREEQAQAKLNQALAKLQELGIDPDTF
ncbi:MAG: hypothetical protein CUN56_16835, partial [Phototrophicales bacterium]